MRSIRRYFDSRGFIEVETPYLVASPGMEPHLEAFKTVFNPAGDQPDFDLYLPTSPEFHMKRLLAEGLENIYQIARAFRNGETGKLHNPEFTILEWYRAYSGYEQIMNDIELLLSETGIDCNGTSSLKYGNRSIELAGPWERLTVQEAWLRCTGIDILETTTTSGLYEAGRSIRVLNLNRNDPWDVLYFKIFLDRIEPRLGLDRPVILYEYPASMSALARLKPDDPRVALRFEAYIAGIELANAFDELRDPEEQRRRFEDARRERMIAGREPFPLDEAFLNALQKGLPPCAGIALGIDRLIMVLADASSVREVIAFPFSPHAD